MVVGLSGIKEWLGQIRAEKDACKYIIYTESMYFLLQGYTCPLKFCEPKRVDPLHEMYTCFHIGMQNTMRVDTCH